MKQFILVFVISALSIVCKSQDDDLEKTTTYRVVSAFEIEDYNLATTKSIKLAKTTIPGTYVTLLKQNTDDVILIINNFNSDETEVVSAFNFDDSGQKYFKADKKEFESKCVAVYKTFAPILVLGSTLVPVRIRPKPSDFAKDLSIGPSIGMKVRLFRTVPVHANLLYSIGISSISLNQDNTFLAANPTQPIDENLDVSALTHAAGLVFEFSNIQFGFFMGWDKLGNSTRNKYSWAHDKLPWYSLGFGINLLSNQNKIRLSPQIDNTDPKNRVKKRISHVNTVLKAKVNK
jgi:hypothetical protein